MKRCICIVLFITIFFTSCNKGNVENGVSLNVSSLNTAFSLKLNDVVYSGEMIIKENNVLKLTFLYPEEVSGLIILADEETILSTLEGVSLYVSKEGNTVAQLYEAVALLEKPQSFIKITEGYEFKNDRFTAVLDSQGNLKWLELQRGEFHFG